jgi:excisionase family DNA binding protein
MQAYVTPETRSTAQLRPVDNRSASDQTAVLDLILDHLAARVADQITARLAASSESSADQWLDSRGAANYLGISRDTVRRLAAEGSLPTEQAGTNCKLYFRRSDLDCWRQSGSIPVPLRRAA